VVLSLAGRRFRPSGWPTVATAAVLAGCVALGFWQLDRGRQKQALIEEFRRGSDASVVLTGAVDALPRYQQVIVRGRLDGTRHILLDNMPSSRGSPGYRVLTPLHRRGGRTLLVDRGWVPLGATRQQLPVVTVEAGPRSDAGRLDQLPVPGVRVGSAQAPGEMGWPRVLNFPTQADLETALGQAVESRILLLDASSPDGYQRDWRPSVGFPPERHLGYAIQWFALAVTLVVIFVALSLKSATAERSNGT
jgi:surfeit locus 1 family protein